MAEVGISEVILVVADVRRSLAFYRDVVGLAVDNDGNRKFAWLWAGAPGRQQRVGITAGPLSFGAAHVKFAGGGGEAQGGGRGGEEGSDGE